MPMKTTLDTRRPSARGRRDGPDDLLDDLAGGEVALEAGLAGGAEPAGHGAAAWVDTHTVDRPG